MRGELSGGCAGAAVWNRRRTISRDAAISMSRTANSGLARGWARLAACLFLILGFSTAAQDRFQVTFNGSHHTDRTASASVNGVPATSASSNHFQVRSYFMDFAGDHSLDVATVTEQPSAEYAKYTVRLHLASGADQSVVVSAPPGGLQVEMHDMTGDKVQNDVVLRPVLVRWLPTVLVNDGHEHFEVALSGKDPSSFSSNKNIDSRPHETMAFALLKSSRLKTVHLPNCERFSGPRFQQCLLSSFPQAIAPRLGHAVSPGRAPPLPTTI
jgi:hypothetical protein